MKPTTVLIDSNNLIRRAIHASALDDLQAGGMFTGGIYGAWNSLSAFLRSGMDAHVGRIVAFFDCGIPPQRLKLIPEYKAKRQENRDKLPEEEVERAYGQIHYTRVVFEHLGIICLAYKNREADDCIAAATQVLTQCQQPVVVVSGDKDLRQCVHLGARVWDLNNSRMIDAENFEDIHGVDPAIFLLYRTLVGDPSDGIAGATGCGHKRAMQVIDALLIEIAGSDFPSLATLKASEQFYLIVEMLTRRAAGRLAGRTLLRKYEQAIVDDCDRLKDEMEGIDLTKGFGGITSLAKALERSPKVNVFKVRAFAKRYKFESVSRYSDRFIEPFVWAVQRRDGIK